MARIYEFPRDHVMRDFVEQKDKPAEVIILDYLRENPDDETLSWVPELD